MSNDSQTTSDTRIAVVTGGSRGLGRNIVLSLARHGVASIFTYNANRAEAKRVIALAAEAGGPSRFSSMSGRLQRSTPSTTR